MGREQPRYSTSAFPAEFLKLLHIMLFYKYVDIFTRKFCCFLKIDTDQTAYFVGSVKRALRSVWTQWSSEQGTAVYWEHVDAGAVDLEHIKQDMMSAWCLVLAVSRSEPWR